MINSLPIESFLKNAETLPVIDVRAPKEYNHAHIPGAYNMPLFSDEERTRVGTTYKKRGREKAILLGFDIAGPKWRGFIERALKIAPRQKVCLHCWRGGMRSGVMAWVLDLYGFEVFTLEKGYKSYRHWVLNQFEKKYPLLVLGGLTGSQKTELLQEMERQGEQLVDLEVLAQHQGSAFGSMNRMTQPSQEMFENLLAKELAHLKLSQRIWIEDESRTIGRCVIPGHLFAQMRRSKVIKIEISPQQRLDFLVQSYGRLDKDFLREKTERIHKRLGPVQTKEALRAIDDNRMADFIKMVLTYYDKAYHHGLSKREPTTVFPLEIDNSHLSKAAKKIFNFANSLQ